MKAIVSAGLIALSLTAAQGQTPPRDQARLTSIGTATVAGVITADDATRAPLRRASILLQRTNSEDMRMATTDDQGHFVFEQLPAASFRLTVGKGGYLSISYGAPKPGMPGRVITLTDGQQFSTGTLALTRGAVVAGRLLDRNGLPVAGAEVTASRFVTIGGERLPRSEDASRTSVTNAHGDYRIHGLVAGEYVVFARSRSFVPQAESTSAEVAWATRPSGPAPAPGRAFTYAPTIFPGVVDLSAGVPVVLARGEERLGVDFSLQSVPVARVSGAVTGPDGKPIARVIVQGLPKRQAIGPEFGFTSTFTGPDGQFFLPNIVPGDNAVVVATAQDGGRPGAPPVLLWGRADLSVFGQDIAGVSIQLQPGLSLSGRLVIAAVAGTPPPDFSRLRIALTSELREMGIVSLRPPQISADGTFTFEGVLPGPYRLNVPVPAATGAAASPWSLRSAMLGDRDIADVQFEINASVSNLVVTLTDVQAQVSGMLTDRAGQPSPDLYVLMFSTDRKLWSPGTRRTKSARALENGSYTIDALPGGEYFLCALTEVDLMLINDATYLEQLIPSSIKITLAEGEKKKQDLRVVR